MVLAAAMRGKTRGRIQIGADDPSLTAAGGMLAVTELCERLGLIAALDEGMGPVKQRRRGFTGGQVLAGMAAAQLAGEDFLVGLDRVRADQAGQLVTPVPGLATSTATGIARRFTAGHWRGAEAGLAAATARMVSLLPAERTAELAEGPVTIDIDATDVEVYGSKKRGVAYNYQGQRAGRPHVASWAETEIPLAAGLLAGDQDPRSHVTGLLGRALAALPQAVRDGAAAAGRKIALRADAGYFAGELARAAAKENMAFAIGAKRIPSMWKALAAVPDDAWRDAIDMDNAQVAVSPYRPAGWPDSTVLLIRRVRLDPDQVSADPRSRRRRTLHPDQRAMLFPELEQQPAIYAYSFICTNLDCSAPAKAAAVEHWYRHRTSAENIFRDSKHGAALRHLPSGHEQVNTAWMWASLIAAAIAAWLHQLTGLIQGGELVEGHGTRGGKAMIATLRRVLIAVPARLVRHGGQLLMRLAPVSTCCPASSPPSGPCQPPPASRRRPAPPACHAFEAPVPGKRPPRPRTSERPRTREPGATPGSLPCPHAGRPHSKIIHLPVDNVRRSTRGFGSEPSCSIASCSGRSPAPARSAHGNAAGRQRGVFDVGKDRAVEALRLAWGDACEVSVSRDKYRACRVDGDGEELTGDTPDELYARIRADWARGGTL